MAEEESGSGHSEQPIIFKKIKKGGHGHHGGAWKVAYADFVTALMAFFIVMWILASGEEVKEAVAAYFNSPESYDIFTGVRTAPVTLFDSPAPPSSGSGGGSGGGEGSNDGSGGGEGQSEGGGFFQFSSGDKNTSDTSQINAKVYQAVKDSLEAVEQVKGSAEELKRIIEKMADNSGSAAVKDMLSNISITTIQEGMLIELLETHDNNFFEVGSAKLKPAAVEVLKQLGARIGRLGNHIEIEGHTDSRGYAGGTYTNWELSADRANSARRILDASGLWKGQVLSVTGYADRRLRNPNSPFDNTNRRVSILVKNISTKEFLNANSGGA
jgi:chemotaxis protein MotB